MREDRITHGTLVNHPAGAEDSAGAPSAWPPSARTCLYPPSSLGLLRVEAGVLRVEVGVGAGCRFEGHGADGALVENLAVRRLDVGLDGVHTPKHHRTAGAPGEGQGDAEMSQGTSTPPTARASPGPGQSPAKWRQEGLRRPCVPGGLLRQSCSSRGPSPHCMGHTQTDLGLRLSRSDGALERPAKGLVPGSTTPTSTWGSMGTRGRRGAGTCIPHGARNAGRLPGGGSGSWLAGSCPRTRGRRGGAGSYACAGGR